MQRLMFNTDGVAVTTGHICDCQTFVLHVEWHDIKWHLQCINCSESLICDSHATGIHSNTYGLILELVTGIRVSNSGVNNFVEKAMWVRH
jgi:hypothetical protein